MKSELPGLACVILLVTGCASDNREWLAGDHHIHSEFSVGWDESTNPPSPIVGGDAIYSMTKNAEMARQFGLDWMVATDHGGPNHSKISLELAYPSLQQSRRAVPEVIQFVGLELNTPAADHSSIIVPHTHDEAERLVEYESRFDTREPWPWDESRQRESLMLEALEYADGLPIKPVVIAHHPSRSATGLHEYGKTTPRELRAWNDRAPDVAVGMEGAPGHQAAVFSERKTGYPDWVYMRGAYGRGHPTHGGFDQMTAVVGGFWDAMLGEGRRWWITANSDSHVHYTEGGIDFWPGEYSKTYVYAEKNHDDILEGIRTGRVFVTLGDLISELQVTLEYGASQADIGGELRVPPGEAVTATILFKDPAGPNFGGSEPTVQRVDVILGEVSAEPVDPGSHHHPTARVIRRFSSEDWQRDGEWVAVSFSFTPAVSSYLRVRGTNTAQLEPERDTLEENPWDDLWFYANPVFLTVTGE